MQVLQTLLDSVRATCAGFPDKRRGGDVTYSMADIGLSAFSLFFMQSESFLSYQRSLEEGRKTSNCHSLFGMKAIPTDNHIRSMLDPVHPSHLQPAFDQVLDVLRRRGGLQAFQRLGDRVLIALDGTEYFCSQKLGCPQCLTRKRSNGKTESYHSMLAATIVAPGHAMALPLMPEFIASQDGAEKQDCERNAAKRWLSTHGGRLKDLRPIYLGDDLFACQPIADAITAAGGDFLLTAKPSSHKALYDFMQGATLDEHTVAQKAGSKRLTYRYRWFEGAPLCDGNDAMLVNWVGVTITDAKGKVTYDNAFVTSLPVTTENVAELVACARARWKIENESFNVLKSNGYHLEHNFGHGKQYLAMMFAALNLLAFAIHTVCDCLEQLWIDARTAKRSRTRFFEHIRTITAYLVFPDWNTLMQTLIDSKPPPDIAAQITG
ncbi:MAG: transposase [Pseudomonadota bacterium]|nr:transposase [Pseudomonadota bacterium]